MSKAAASKSSSLRSIWSLSSSTSQHHYHHHHHHHLLARAGLHDSASNAAAVAASSAQAANEPAAFYTQHQHHGHPSSSASSSSSRSSSNRQGHAGSSSSSSTASGPSSSSSTKGTSHLPSFWLHTPAASAGYTPTFLFSPAQSAVPNPSASATTTSGRGTPSPPPPPPPQFRLNSAPSISRIPTPTQSSLHSANHLTLYHGAYGIPKRPRQSPPSPATPRSSASAKGKGRAIGDGNGEGSGSQSEAGDSSNDDAAALRELQAQKLLSVQVGEDAYFVRHNSLGVADGVGGWSGKKGADPGLFAARLMHHCALELARYDSMTDAVDASAGSGYGSGANTPQLYFSSSSSSRSRSGSSAPSQDDGLSQAELGKPESNPTTTPRPVAHSIPQPTYQDHPDTVHPSSPPSASDLKLMEGDPIEILHRAWDATLTEFFDLELVGSTTALIALLKDDELRLANLGDCCCSIIRDKEYIFRSQEQQHSFNYPYQMGTNSQDTPRKDGQSFTIKVQRDDIVILSSDGLVDNLFDEDILEEVFRHRSNPQELSQALCSRAKAVSEDQRAVTSPFQQRANEEGIHFVGGKHDDISVLVAVIGDAAAQQQRDGSDQSS